MANDYRGLFEAAIARLQPGGAMEKYQLQDIESGGRTAIGASMQNLISGMPGAGARGRGLSGTSLAGNVPLIQERSNARSRLGVTAAREQLLGEKEAQLGGLLFQGAEREKGQAFQAGENLLGRQFTSAENKAARTFTSAQAALDRGFTGSENEKQRQLTVSQNALSREFEAKQNELLRQYTSVEARKSEEFKTKQDQLTRDFTAAQNALDRAAGVATEARRLTAAATEQSSAQAFTAAQNALGRTATAEQNAAQLSAQYPSLTGGGTGDIDRPPDIIGDIFGGATSTGGWSSYLGSGGGSLGAPQTGQSWVNGQYIPTAAEEKAFYSKPTVAQPTLVGQAIQKLFDQGAMTPSQAYQGGWTG